MDESQPLLELRGLDDRGPLFRGDGVGGSASRVTSASLEANRVSPSCHGKGVLHAGHVSLLSFAGAPHDGHRSAGLTQGF